MAKRPASPAAPEPAPALAGAAPWRDIPGGVELAVRLTPRGGRAAIDGIAEAGGQPVLRVRVAAPPVDGAANAALIDCLARALDLPRAAITLHAGDHARVKRLRLTGPDLAARLAALAGTR